MRGDYRKVIVKPGDLEWSIRTYDNSSQQLIPTDLDILEGRQYDNLEGPKKALIVSFNLPSSSYATMALREVLGEEPELEEEGEEPQ